MPEERTPIPMDDILSEICVPELGSALADFHAPEITATSSKDLFAAQKHKSWDKSVEARCDFKRHVRITPRASVYFFSLWQKSIFGRTLTDIKADDSMVSFFASEIAPLISEIFGHNLTSGNWCIITTPKRRHLVRNFATRISQQLADILQLPFYEDVCSSQTRQRVNAIFTVNTVPREQNIICFDDFCTTGSTFAAMKRALQPYNKNMVFVAGINNKL